VNSIPINHLLDASGQTRGVDIRQDRSKHLDAVVGKRMKHEAVIVEQLKDGAEILPEKNPASNQKYLSVSQVTLVA